MADNTKNYELPSDIALWVRNNRMKKVLMFLFIEVFCLFVMWYYREEIFPFWQTFRRGIFFTVLVIAPFVFTKVPFCFIDKNWRGKITDIKYYTDDSIWAHVSSGKSVVRAGNRSVVARSSDSGKRLGYRSRYTVDVVVKRDDGSLKSAKVSTFGGAISSYKIGDTAIHFKGVEELLILSALDDGILNCIVCGCNNPKTRDYCFGCGYTLLKEYDKKEEKEESFF